MQFFDSSSHQLGYSQIRSTSGNNELSRTKNGNYHSLPHITQPILAKYRIARPSNELVIEETSSFWCKLFSISSREKMSLCRCERTEEGHCEMVMRWI